MAAEKTVLAVFVAWIDDDEENPKHAVSADGEAYVAAVVAVDGTVRLLEPDTDKTLHKTTVAAMLDALSEIGGSRAGDPWLDFGRGTWYNADEVAAKAVDAAFAKLAGRS